MAELYAAVRRAADPEEGWRLWRAGRDALFAEHPASPLAGRDRSRSFGGLPIAPYDPSHRFLVDVDPPDDGGVVEIPAGRDGTVRLRPSGRTRGLADALGGELTVYWIDGYGGGLFLPFRDGSAGTASFGGGRYLLDTLKGADLGMAADGRLVVDFNFAYNPSCAYSNAWVCPLAPPPNRLGAVIEAGERTPGVDHGPASSGPGPA